MIDREDIPVGIDLGTTTSLVAYVDKKTGKAKVVEIGNNSAIVPSCVAWQSKQGQREEVPIVGDRAINQGLMNPEGTVFEAKRLIGCTVAEINKRDPNLLKSLPYKVVADESGHAAIEIPGLPNLVSPEQCGAYILSYVVRRASEVIGRPIKEAVITVPAYFDNSQKQRTEVAGEIAGLKVLRLMMEPTAAAIAYGLDQLQGDSKVLVYDMGGGTFDVSVMDVSEGVYDVKATNGDAHLGGSDFDKKIIQYITEGIERTLGIKADDPTAKQRIREAAEQAKKRLSSDHITTINLPFIGQDASGPKNFSCQLSRAEFESMCGSLIERSITACKAALKASGLTTTEVDNVILVGGMTRMPAVREAVDKMFGSDKVIKGEINPDEMVARGAALQAAVLGKSFGDDTFAAPTVLDVTPLSLGIETMGGVFNKLVPAGTTIPTTKAETFTTAEDGQSYVQIKVYQGEREMAQDNKFLGEFTLSGIKQAPRGVPQIKVSFDVNPNGLLVVSAVDTGSGTQQDLTITSSSKPNPEEVARMKEEAERYKAVDEERKQLAEEKNRGYGVICDAEKTLKENEKSVSQEDGIAAHSAISALREVLAGDNKTSITNAINTLMDAIKKVRDYSSANPNEAPHAAPQEDPDKDK